MIKLVNIYKKYLIDNEITFTALKDVNLQIRDGEYVSIMGPSGSGKSTLMHIIGLLDNPSHGEIFIRGRKVNNLTDNKLSSLRNVFVGFVFQQFNLINKLTVLENVLLPTIYSRKKLNFDGKKRALELLFRFGLKGKENSYPNKISGGQQQRVAVARALIMSPDLILADEPTGNLDSHSGAEVLDLLDSLNSQDKKTIMIVTHDQTIAKRAKRIISIKDGKIVRDNFKK